MTNRDHLDLFGAILPDLQVNHLPGKLINIDTLDGAGNSTQSELLAAYLNNVLGVQTMLTKEPTDGIYGQLIRKVLKKEMRLDKWALQQLFAVDRSDHLDNQKMRAALVDGAWVVTARYALSTLAFGISQGIPAWQLLTANIEYPWPNLNIVLKLEVDECLRRIAERNLQRGVKSELFEEKATLERTMAAYESLAQRLPNVYFVDGFGTPPEVFIRVRALVHDKLAQYLPPVK